MKFYTFEMVVEKETGDQAFLAYSPTLPVMSFCAFAEILFRSFGPYSTIKSAKNGTRLNTIMAILKNPIAP